MIRKVLLVLSVPVFILAACGKQEPAAPPAPAVPATVAPATEPLPPPAEVGDSCSKDCGNGVTAAIQCAEGEIPVCDCAAPQNAVCNPPPAAAQ